MAPTSLPPTNFAHLQQHDHQLVRLGMLAEKYFAGDQFISPTLVLAEIAGAVARRTGDARAANEAVAAIARIP